jgi:hypothetical protein
MPAPTIAFGESDNTWAKYDLSQMPIKIFTARRSR